MVSFRVQKKLGPRPGSVSFRGLIQNCRRASPPLSYAECPPPPPWDGGRLKIAMVIVLLTEKWTPDLIFSMTSWHYTKLYQMIHQELLVTRLRIYSVRSKFYSRSLNSVEITKEQRSQSHVSRDQESPLRKGLIYIHLSDQFRLLGNCKPNPPLSHHFVLSKK